MKRIVGSVAQLVGALLGLAIIVFGGALLVMRTGYGGAIAIFCGALLLPRVFSKVTAKLSYLPRALIALALVIAALTAGIALEGEPRTKQTAADRHVAAIDERRASEVAKCDSPSLAYVMAQGFVKGRLVAPASAKFPSISETAITPQDECKFKIQSFVDSQNSFGAMLRKTFTAEVRYNPQSDEWLLEDLVM